MFRHTRGIGTILATAARQTEEISSEDLDFVRSQQLTFVRPTHPPLTCLAWAFVLAAFYSPEKAHKTKVLAAGTAGLDGTGGSVDMPWQTLACALETKRRLLHLGHDCGAPLASIPVGKRLLRSAEPLSREGVSLGPT